MGGCGGYGVRRGGTRLGWGAWGVRGDGSGERGGGGGGGGVDLEQI